MVGIHHQLGRLGTLHDQLTHRADNHKHSRRSAPVPEDTRMRSEQDPHFRSTQTCTLNRPTAPLHQHLGHDRCRHSCQPLRSTTSRDWASAVPNSCRIPAPKSSPVSHHQSQRPALGSRFHVCYQVSISLPNRPHDAISIANHHIPKSRRPAPQLLTLYSHL